MTHAQIVGFITRSLIVTKFACKKYLIWPVYVYVRFLEVKLFVFSFLTMFFYVCSGCLLAQQNARALRTSANDNKEWQAIWTGGFEGLQKLNLRNVHQNSPKDVKNIRKFLGYVCAYKLYHQ